MYGPADDDPRDIIYSHPNPDKTLQVWTDLATAADKINDLKLDYNPAGAFGQAGQNSNTVISNILRLNGLPTTRGPNTKDIWAPGCERDLSKGIWDNPLRDIPDIPGDRPDHASMDSPFNLPGPAVGPAIQKVANHLSDSQIARIFADKATFDTSNPRHRVNRLMMRGIGRRPDLDFVSTMANGGRAVSRGSWKSRPAGAPGGEVHVDAYTYTRDGPNGPVGVSEHTRGRPRRRA